MKTLANGLCETKLVQHGDRLVVAVAETAGLRIRQSGEGTEFAGHRR